MDPELLRLIFDTGKEAAALAMEAAHNQALSVEEAKRRFREILEASYAKLDTVEERLAKNRAAADAVIASAKAGPR